ncbi:MAG: FAD-binding protein [Candidatus Parvarchaeota archaeon]|nr:FAD-binding protein [Candidatus Parvarchaeum tengchongense]MCW1298948.1 FAD-binding protein [Candidatus Parvarchaeum tengchongense]MCW1312018.1 FAD-binding protein [Candidatus Parvarchaeum tengchongense]
MANGNYKAIDTDLLIIGAGGSGLRAAVEALNTGVSVTILSKSLLGKAHTVMAEGGIAASLGDVDPEDNWKVHFKDTMVEGVYLSDWRLVEKLAKEAPDRVYELERMGALFDRTPEKKIMQRAFGAHTYRRLCHVGDKTGLELLRTLEDKIIHSENVKIMDEVFVTKLVKKNDKVIGAIALDMKKGEFIAINSKSTIIAGGGCGRIYEVTSNSWESTGDGIALAFDAGAEMMDMEMMQFHPTGMVWPPGVRGLLVTEGVRGEGGLLYNTKGERFMLRYSPQKKELDARDVVARSIYNEIQEGRGTEHGGVFLDISYKGKDFIMKKLPGMYMQFKEFAGVDITKEKMEVAPTTHYYMGGIKVDSETNSTNVKGLFAVGEAAAGVHGANRLGGNSLADLLVFGKYVGINAAEYAKKANLENIPDNEVKEEIKRVSEFINPNGTNPYSLTEKLRKTMSENVGIVRNEQNMQKALSVILDIKKEYKNIGVAGNLQYNPGLLQCLELHSMLEISELLVRGAIMRKESRGAHYRSDFPKKDRKWLKNIVFKKNEDKLESYTFSPPEMPPYLKEILPEESYE